MSGSDYQRTECSCHQTHCLGGKCSCFKAKLLCSPYCMCDGCQNTESNKAEVELRYQVYLKRKIPVVDNDKYPSVPPDGFPVPPGFSGCRCRKIKCTDANCACFKYFYKCTSKCKCQDCANPKGLKGSDTNTEPGQGGAGGVSSVPDEVVQTTPSSNINSGQIGDTDSTAEEPAQMEEQSTQSRDNSGSDQNKRPRKSPPPSVDSFPSPPVVVVPPGGFPVPPDFSGCKCKKIKCANGKCPCFGQLYRCTSKCKCQDCDNPKGIVRSDTNTEPRQGDTGGVSNVPDEAGQTTPPSNINKEQADDTSSMADQPAQI